LKEDNFAIMHKRIEKTDEIRQEFLKRNATILAFANKSARNSSFIMPNDSRRKISFVHKSKIDRSAGGGQDNMGRQLTFQQYRTIDLTLLAVMLAVFEFIIVMAARFWFPGQPFAVSMAGAITAIAYMRWGYWGGIHAVLAGLVFCFFSGGTGGQYLIYCAGNLLSLLSVILLNKAGKEQVRTGHLALVFPLLVLLLMQTGRAAVALLLGAAPASVLDFYTTDSLSMLFTFVIIWIARRLDGIYEDQKHYLLRIHAKEE
jgi:hypothetical protein